MALRYRSGFFRADLWVNRAPPKRTETAHLDGVRPVENRYLNDSIRVLIIVLKSPFF